MRAYLRCGILAHGFLRARCEDCGEDNREAVDRAVAGGDIRVLFNSNVKSFGTDQAILKVAAEGEDAHEEVVPMQHSAQKSPSVF